MSSVVHRVYLIPGMFGFAKLAGYDYFEHVERHLSDAFREAEARFILEIIQTPPTASIRRRARVVAEHVHRTAGDSDDPIHLIGHSTGGLDARLLASPETDLDLGESTTAWIRRLRSVVTLNAPHHGTPLATFFTSVSGVRLLYALSLLTFGTLKYGGPPLTVFSTMIATLGSLDEIVGLDIKLLDRTTELLLRFVGAQGRDEVRQWLDGIRKDQGGIVQLTPEAMDLFNAATTDSDAIRYGCVATVAPKPSPIRLMTRIRSPYSALSAGIYSTVWSITSREHAHYPCPAPNKAQAKILEESIDGDVTNSYSDGIVPTLSMLWGTLLWAGSADHLDVVGHFADDRKRGEHVDWLHSGAKFSRLRFAQAMHAVASFLLESANEPEQLPRTA